MKALLVLTGLLMCGCATLHTSVFQNIHEGDTKDHVLAVLGEPDSFGASQRIEGATAFYYKRRADICGITLQDDIVKYIGCSKDPNYKHPTAAFTKGLADGYNGARKSQTTCTTSGSAGTATTICN